MISIYNDIISFQMWNYFLSKQEHQQNSNVHLNANATERFDMNTFKWF